MAITREPAPSGTGKLGLEAHREYFEKFGTLILTALVSVAYNKCHVARLRIFAIARCMKF